MEKLFSQEQLGIIKIKAEQEFEVFWNRLILNGEETEVAIVAISTHNHLIFVKGNEDTGYNHLSDRHSFFSNKHYWIAVSSNEFKLDDPSKFHPRMMPIVDYAKIADAIFSVENKNITKNNRPDIFDKYTGHYTYIEGTTEKYHLLTYKDTKVVHTLFPDKKKYNLSIKGKFGRGEVSTSFKYPEGFNDLIIPYQTKEGRVCYSILFRKYLLEKIERLIIQTHDSNGEVSKQFFLGYRYLENFNIFEREDMKAVQYGNLSNLEKIINQIDNEQIDGRRLK